MSGTNLIKLSACKVSSLMEKRSAPAHTEWINKFLRCASNLSSRILHRQNICHSHGFHLPMTSDKGESFRYNSSTMGLGQKPVNWLICLNDSRLLIIPPRISMTRVIRFSRFRLKCCTIYSLGNLGAISCLIRSDKIILRLAFVTPHLKCLLQRSL